MSQGAVLDASAVLALLQDEPGAAVVEDVLGDAAMSSVNWAEVAGSLAARGLPATELRESVEALGISVLAFDVLDADATGELLPSTRDAGLSLADRACLALASRLDAPALTADRAWLDLELCVDVHCIRA